MEMTTSSDQGEEGDLCPRPKSKSTIGLVRKLTKGGPPKLFLMKNMRKTNNAKASKAGQSGSGAGLRYQAGVAASGVRQEDDETAAGADCRKKGHSGNTKISPWAVAPGIDEKVFEDNAGSGGGDSRSTGEENEETCLHQSSLKSNRPLLEVKGDNGDGLVPVQHKIKSRKEPRQKSERRQKGPRGPSATWGALICVKKNRKSRVNEAERRSSNNPQATLPETKDETQKQSGAAAQVCRAQSEDTYNSAGSGIRAEPLEQNLPLSGASGLSGQEEEDADESKASEVEGGPEISRSNSQAKLRRKTTGRGWSSFRYLVASKKEWRSFTEKSVDSLVHQCQQVESAETGMLQDSQDSEITASSNSKAPLAKLLRGKKKKSNSPSKDPEAPADPTGSTHRDSEILRPETVVVSLAGDQDSDLHPPGVSKRCQPESYCEKMEEQTGIKGTLPATLQDELGLSEEKGQAASVKGMQESDQLWHDFALLPSESMLSLQTTPQGMQGNIGTAKMNPSHLLESDGFPEQTAPRAEDLLQEKSTQATLGMVMETERQGLAKEHSDEAGPALKGSGYLCKPSTVELQSISLPKQDSTEELELPELLSIEESRQTPRQDSAKQESSNLDEFNSKNTNPVCYYPKHGTEQVLGSQESTNGTMLGVMERGALSREMKVELKSTVPSSDSIHPSSCCEGAASCECQVHKCANWNHLSEDRRCVAECGGEWGIGPPSDGVPGHEFSGLSGGPEMREAVLVQTASCIVQSAVRAAVELVVGETAMNGVPETPPARNASHETMEVL